MIRLTKLTEMHDVYGSRILWLREQRIAYRAARQNREPTDRFLTQYRNDSVKDAILVETHGKCAYCESKYMAVAWGDVEHILPKARDPERILDYGNLTLVCSVCNGRKSDKEYADGHPLLHPYADEPATYLTGTGPLMVPIRDDEHVLRARRTIDDIALNRAALLERRSENIERCDALRFEYDNAPTQPLRQYALHRIGIMQLDEAEYALIARIYFRTYMPHLFP